MKRLDHKLDCKACGTIYLDIPADVQSHTPIYCSSCGDFAAAGMSLN
ncbi:ribosomal protein S27E [Phyllobacterium sp. 1468]|nr:ribosomal protein S27E [Phyllobacterium sp. 1468]